MPIQLSRGWCQKAPLPVKGLNVIMLLAHNNYCFNQVEFLGEQGSDTGGLTREFFRLVGYHAAAP